MQAFLLTLSTILIVAAGLIYCASIIRGRTKPHRTTRFVVLVILTLSFVSILAAHANLGAKVYSGILFVSAIAFLGLSLRAGSGMGGTSVFDWVCLVVALAGVVAWQVSDNPILGIWFALLADLIAYLPAYVKTWRYPHTETPWLYALSALASFLSLVAYKISAVSIFQVFMIIYSLIMLVCIYHAGPPLKARQVKLS
jgi:hypothetical protein